MAKITTFQGYSPDRPPTVPKPDKPVDPMIVTVQDGVPVAYPGCHGLGVRVVHPVNPKAPAKNGKRIACVGGGSNAIGLFHAFRSDLAVKLVGVEAGGESIESGRHAARFAVVVDGHASVAGRPGVLHGAYTYVLQDPDGQIANTYSISAGLDYAAVGPEHVFLRETGRAEYTYATDEQALQAFQLLARTEGILCALESAHAIAEVIQRAPALSKDQILLVNLSGRGDKDLDTITKALAGVQIA